MPQTLTLDDLAAYGAASSPAAAAPAKTLTLSQLADYGAPVDLRPRNVGPSQPQSAWKQFVSGATEEQPDDSSHGFLRSFYDASVRPIVGMVHDSYVRGDLGEHAVSEMLDSFKDQLGTFAAHPDIRNLPVIGTGATATAARAQKQFDEGNYTGAAGTMLGFLGQFAAPELIKTPPGAADLPESVAAAARTAADAGQDVGAGARAAAPDAAKAAGKAAVGVALHKAGLGFAGDLTGLDIGVRGASRSLKAGLDKGIAAYQAARAARLSEADAATVAGLSSAEAQAAEDAAYARLPATPPESWEPGTPGTPAPPARWEPYRAPSPPGAAPQALTLDQLAEYGAASTADEAALDRAPDARLTLSPELAARADELRQETHASYHAPDAKPQALTPANKIQDAADAWKAYQAMQAQDIEMGNRAAQADRIAAHLIKNGQEATDANIATADKATANLSPTTPTGKVSRRATPPPSDETADMIRDRVDWHNARQAAAAPVEAAAAPGAISATEQQLRDSLAARGVPVNLESGRPAETQTPQPASAPGSNVDTGGTGGRPAIAAPDRARAGTQGERTAVDIPGEQRAYPATYAVKELADIQPSHLGETFQPNPEYGYKNDRNYDDPRNQGKIVNWSTREGFNPRNLLNTAPTAEIGPPVVDAAGNVLGGNGRSMIMQRVYRSNPEGAAAYRAELDRTAAHYGIDPASYAHMKEPVLVRTLDPEIFKDEATAQRAVTDFNKTGTAALTPAERAIADSRGVSIRTLDDIAARMDKHGADATLAQTLEGRAGVEVMQNLTRDGVISPQEQAELSTGSKLTKAGKERISGLMLGRFFTDAKQLDSLSDSMRNKMERIAAPLARVEGIPEYALSGHVREALSLIEDADAHGAATLDDYLKQQGLFGTREYSPETIAFAKALGTRNPVALTNAVRAYATRAKYAQEFQGPGMFNDIPAPLKPGAAFAESFGQ